MRSYKADEAKLVIRADAGPDIGAGHVARCAAVADAAVGLGYEVLFVCSDEVSRTAVKRRGYCADVVTPFGSGSGVSLRLGSEDAQALFELASGVNARCVFVDSYAASKVFWSELALTAARQNMRTGCFDDLFNYEDGLRSFSSRLPIGVLVNYSFGSILDDYAVYQDSLTNLLIGPHYAPVRAEFKANSPMTRNRIDNILITSGATNPNRFLEVLVEACHEVCPNACLNVVVGFGASYDGRTDKMIRIHKDVKDMSLLMRQADMAISAAGFTLYELAAMGVPTIAIPLVENQIANARGFETLQAGCAVTTLRPETDTLRGMIASFAKDFRKRRLFSEKLRAAVDGNGAVRIVQRLMREL